ncbi:MAG: glutathione S-transferase family protein [Polyangiaceae bacterium]|jgi:glutathione S-transferase
MMKLYQHPFSTFSRRVRIALLEKKIEAELVLVDMIARAHKAEPYISLNPYARVPTLVDDGLVLYESTTILEYIEAKYAGTAPLVPPDLKGRALVSMNMKLCDLQMTRQAGTIIFAKRFVPEASWRRDDMAKAAKEIDKHFAILDRELAGKTYLVAETYTLADLCYVPFLEFLPLMDVEVPGNVKAWSERLLSRPSSVATKPAR